MTLKIKDVFQKSIHSWFSQKLQIQGVKDALLISTAIMGQAREPCS